MADNLDPKQIEDLNQNLADLVATLGGVSQTTGSVGDANKTAALKSKLMGDGLDKALGAATGLTKSLYKGEKGAGVFGDAVEEAADALGLLVLAIFPFSLAAKAAALAIGVFAKGLNVAAKQGDALYKTYQDLQRSGATAADGITGVFHNMQNFGYGIEELDKMVKLVSENSQTLAKFSLTAADGTNAFSSAMADIVRDPALKVLGKTPDDINAAGAAFIRQTVRAGMTQRDVGDQLASQTLKYVYDLDRLQKLTGTSADQLQKQQDEAMAEDAYNDVMSDLKQRALAGDAVAQAQIDKITLVMSKLGPEMRKEFIASIGGDISAGARLFMGAPSLMRNIQDETVSTTKTINDLHLDAANTVGAFGKSARLAAQATRETIGPLYEYRELMSGTADFDERVEAAKRAGKVQDEATINLSKIDLERMNSRDALQSFVQLGVAPATRALAKMAGITGDLATSLPGNRAGNTGQRPDAIDKMLGTTPSTTGKLAGINPQLASALEKATEEYKQITGKTATITSGVRDREKQERMYNESIAAGRPGRTAEGRPIAKPGSSLHETGNAVDVDTMSANEMDRLGLLKKYGLDRPVAGDPVHIQLAKAGPLNGYNSQIANLNPTKTLDNADAKNKSVQTAPNYGDNQLTEYQLQLLAAQQEANDLARRRNIIAEKQLKAQQTV